MLRTLAVSTFALIASVTVSWAVPVFITVGYGGTFETFPADTIGGSFTVSSMNGMTYVYGVGFPDYSMNGTTPGGETQTTPGFYKTGEQIEYDFGFTGIPVDAGNFAVSSGFFSTGGVNRAVYFGYTVNSDGTIDENGPLVDDFTVTSFAVSTTMSTVPLPSSAPMFGAALLTLGAVGYGAKRKKVVVAI